MGKPIGEKHAIEVASFIVVFERAFEASAIAALPGLQAKLQNDYQTFTPTNSMEVRVADGEVSQQIGTSGGLLQSFLPDGRPGWTLRVEGNAIAVSCTDYKRWGDISAKALSHIQAAMAYINNDTNAVSSLIHQIVDRFVTASSVEYNINQVFNTQSPYLTQQALKAGKLWHVYQGWFDDKQELNGKLLNVLNVSTSESPAGGTLTTIDHAVHLRFTAPKALGDFDDNFIRTSFNELHECNKAIIKQLLTNDQLKTIGLL